MVDLKAYNPSCLACLGFIHHWKEFGTNATGYNLKTEISNWTYEVQLEVFLEVFCLKFSESNGLQR